MVKLSECGIPKRRLWLTLKSISQSLSDMVDVVINHMEIFAPCPTCKRHEAFERTYQKSSDHIIWYRCINCGGIIEVEDDQRPFGDR